MQLDANSRPGVHARRFVQRANEDAPWCVASFFSLVLGRPPSFPPTCATHCVIETCRFEEVESADRHQVCHHLVHGCCFLGSCTCWRLSPHWRGPYNTFVPCHALLALAVRGIEASSARKWKIRARSNLRHSKSQQAHTCVVPELTQAPVTAPGCIKTRISLLHPPSCYTPLKLVLGCPRVVNNGKHLSATQGFSSGMNASKQAERQVRVHSKTRSESMEP